MSWIGDLFSSVATGGIQAGLDLYGGGAADRANRRAMQKQYDLGVQFDSTAIQRRVADAEKAGVHPLFALGASPAQGPSLSVVPSEKGEAFRAVSRSIGNRKTPAERAFEMVQLEEMKSRTALNFAQASAIASDQARLGQQSNTTGPLPPGTVKDVASEQISSKEDDPATQAGDLLGFRKMLIGRRGGYMMVPDPQSSEIFENLGPLGWVLGAALTTHKNVEEAGAATARNTTGKLFDILFGPYSAKKKRR